MPRFGGRSESRYDAPAFTRGNEMKPFRILTLGRLRAPHSRRVSTLPIPSERRRYGRVRLETPLPAQFAGTRARLLEISVAGTLIAHEGKIAPGATHDLEVDWEGTRLVFSCRVARSTLWRLAKSAGERSIYHSGLKILDASGDSSLRLRELLAERIIRALEEQKANARGIPPLAAYMYQPGKGELYRRCELIDGVWRKSETIRSTQPPNGFTISTDVEPAHVEMLCETWEGTTAEGRRLTQMLAELSIDRNEGVPVRRYLP